MRPKIVAILFTILAVLAFVAFIWSAMRESESLARDKAEAEKADVTIAMKWNFAPTMAPYFAAQRNGVFEEAGLRVELVAGGPGNASSVHRVLVGDAEFGITGAYELVKARASDQPVKSIAVIFKQSPVCLISFSETGIRSPRDLRGKSVEMTSGDNAEVEYLAMLRKAGVDPSEVDTRRWKWVYGNLKARTVDAVVVYENDQAISLTREQRAKGQKLALLCPREYGVQPYADVLFTTENMIDDDEDTVRRVVNAILESWEWAALNVEETADHFLASPQLQGKDISRDTAIAAVSKSVEFVAGSSQGVAFNQHIPDIGWQERDRWQEQIDLIGEFERSSNALPSPGECFTNRWVGLHRMQEAADNASELR